MLLQFGAGAFPVSATDGNEETHIHSEEENLQSSLSDSSASEAGDTDGDGDVDVADAVYLLRHVLKPQDYPVTAESDMDGDEDTDVADAVYLLRHTLMPSKYPLKVHAHIVVNQQAVAATCTRSGLTAGSYCSDCGEILEAQKVLPPKGHTSEVVEEISADCTQDGMVKAHCDVCDTDFLSELTYAKGHDYGQEQIQTEATCTTDGISLYVCAECGHSESAVVPAKGHTLIASGTTENGTVIYTCTDCGLETQDSSTVDSHKEDHAFGCDKNFTFDIIYDGDEEYIRDHLLISDAYYVDPTTEERLPYDLEYKGDGRWTVSPSEDYEGGNTYCAKIDGDLKFADYESEELYFSIADDVHSDITLSDGIIFIPMPAIGTVDRQQYLLETNTDNEFFYLTMPDDGTLSQEHVGRIVCAGAYKSMDEFTADNSKECYFGKLEKLYATADGKILLVLSCPELYEIYSELDIYENYIVELTEEDIPEDISEQAVYALRHSDDFGEFVTGITLAAKAYADGIGATAVGVDDLSFLDDMGLIPSFKIENDNKLIVSIQGNLPIKLKNKEGKDCGTVTVSFLTKAEYSFTVTGACELKYFLGIPTGVKKFDFNVTQTSSYTLEFSVKVAIDPLSKPEGKSIVKTPLGVYHLKDCLTISAFPKGSLTAVTNDQMDEAYRNSDGSVDLDCPVCNPTMSYLKKNVYVANKDTETIHRFVCAESDRVDATNVEVLESIPLVMDYTLCETCLQGKSNTEEQNFEEMLVDALRYQNWSDIASSVKKALTKSDKPAEKESEFTLMKLPIPFAGIFQLTLEAEMVISFKFSGSVSLTYTNSTTTVAGVRLNSSNTLEPYSSRTMTEKNTTFKVAGGLDVKAGIRFQMNVGMRGFLSKFIYIKLGAEVGTYSDLDGILFAEGTVTEEGGQTDKTSSAFIAAYWEMGLYGDIFFDYKVVFWGNKFSLLGSDKRLPILAFGYDKVYYGYSPDAELIEATGHSIDLTSHSILIANAFDVKKLSSSKETLNILGVKNEYDVIIAVLDENGDPSPYCTVQNGVITIRDDAPCDLTLTVVIKVNGNNDAVDTVADFFKNGYTVGDDLYKLPEYKFYIHVTDHSISEWEEYEAPTCTEDGTDWRYSTCDCSEEEFRVVSALGHQEVIDHAYPATCTEDGATEGSHCERCGEVLIAQEILYAFGHSYTDEFTCHDRPCQNDGCTHVEVATTEHRYSDWIDVPMGECALQDYHVRYCIDCRHSTTDLGTDVPVQHMHDIGIPEVVYPTCTEDGYVIIQCTRCGEELKNDVLIKTGHDLGDYLITNGGHYQKCLNNGCDYQTDVEAHEFDHDCDTDCNECGFTRVTSHVMKTEYSKDGSNHWLECDICGFDGEKEAHSYKANCVICDVCAYLGGGSHSWSDVYNSDDGYHWLVCGECGVNGTQSAHTYEDDCTLCDICDRASGKSHSWSEDYEQNGSHHWRACKNCSQTDAKDAHSYSLSEPIHLATKATCQNAATYYYYCVCGKLGSDTFSYGEVAEHSWNTDYTEDGDRHYRSCKYGCGSVIDEGAHSYGDYKVTKNATCAETGTETRYCTLCDSSDSREIPKKDHAYGDDYEHDDVSHWIECGSCGEKKDQDFHRLGDDLICDVCGYETTAEHDWDPVYRFDDQKHWLVCLDCGIITGEQAHQFTNDCDTDCSICDYTRTTEHEWNASYSNDSTAHWIECGECGEKKDRGDHVYDHSCDTDCNICGKTRNITHEWGTEYSKDSGGHWRVCTVCGEEETKTAHIGGSATCTEAPICTTCKSAYGSANGHDYSGEMLYDDTHHYKLCENGCGTETAREVHKFGDYQVVLTATCTRVGEKRRYCADCSASETRDIPMTEHDWSDTWQKDDTYHWVECNDCGLNGEKRVHVWDNACDTDCNECGKVRTVTHQWKVDYASDESSHWQICENCGATGDPSDHVWDNSCDTECNECGKTRTVQHQWGLNYQTDDEKHWYECEICHERQGEGAHVDGMATCTERAICAICHQPYGTTTDHSYSMRVENSDYLKQAATCEGEGIYYFSCVCGEKGTATFTVAALGHDWSTQYNSDGTYHWLDCSRCSETDGKSVHSGGNATCQDKAVCTTCGKAYGDFGDHDYSVKNNEYKASDATCESPAYYYYTCSCCGKAGNTTYAVGNSLGHSWSNKYTVTDSNHYYECLNGCGDHLSEGVHTYGDYLQTTAPTCTSKGEEKRTCTACGHEQYREVEMLPHEMSDEEEIVTDIVEGDGEYLYIHNIVFRCKNCDYYEVQSTSTAHIHEAVDYILGTPPTCTENGLTSGVICAVAGCGEVRIAQETIDALGHDYVEGICSRCGEREEYYSKGLEYELSSDGTYYIVTEIGTCTDTELVIPSSYNGKPVKEIGTSAFYGANMFTSVTIPENITKIGDNAFGYCTNLERLYINSIELEDLTYSSDAFYYAGRDSGGFSVTFGASVTKIPNNLFYSYYDYTNQIYFVNLKEVVFEENSSCKRIGDGAFRFCAGLTQIELPEGLQYIGASAFADCYNLIDVTMYDEVLEIGVRAFSCCAFQSIRLSNNLTTIGDYAFESCDYLVSVVIPDSVKYLGDAVFYYSISLKEITIGKGVLDLGESLLWYCEALEVIIYNATNANDFENDLCKPIIYITGNSGNGIELIVGANVQRIPANLCNDEGRSNLVKLTFASGSVCQEIGDDAFSYCEKLTAVTLGSCLTRIGERAFLWCTSLTSIKIPNSLTTISTEAFACSGLQTVTLGSGLKTIDFCAFGYCESLKSITIPASVNYIGAYAFDNCVSLKTITFSGSAPEMDYEPFCRVTATVYYPRSNSTWTAEVKEYCGGTLTWIAK
ncbi:MAG: leucine-rich repeat domain-containing protein [Clostridia bacterium]|nr:leucine-rich repeat domain-containing protein [Clostridia bacterium]